MATSLSELATAFDVEMLAHQHVRGVDELWAGKTDIKERRRLQNRLNRRAYRKRQAELRRQKQLEEEISGARRVPGRQSGSQTIPGLHVFALNPNLDRKECQEGSISLKDLVRSSDSPVISSAVVRLPGLPTLQNTWPSEKPWLVPMENLALDIAYDAMHDGLTHDLGSNYFRLEEILLEEGAGAAYGPDVSYSPMVDNLITLAYYDVFRGLSQNIRAMKLAANFILDSDSESPFVTGEIDTSTLAPDLQPSLIQLTISHHPCFDLFPDTVLRDNAITHWAASMPYGHLCQIVAGRMTWHEMEIPSRQGCMLWGAPDNADNWEVTEAFAESWPYIVRGAYRLQAATNRWRAMRGEPAIRFA